MIINFNPLKMVKKIKRYGREIKKGIELNLKMN